MFRKQERPKIARVSNKPNFISTVFTNCVPVYVFPLFLPENFAVKTMWYIIPPWIWWIANLFNDVEKCSPILKKCQILSAYLSLHFGMWVKWSSKRLKGDLTRWRKKLFNSPLFFKANWNSENWNVISKPWVFSKWTMFHFICS